MSGNVNWFVDLHLKKEVKKVRLLFRLNNSIYICYVVGILIISFLCCPFFGFSL